MMFIYFFLGVFEIEGFFVRDFLEGNKISVFLILVFLLYLVSVWIVIVIVICFFVVFG